MDGSTRDAALDSLANRVIIPYLIITGALLVLAIAILFSGLPDLKEEAPGTSGTNISSSNKTSVFHYPHLLLGVLALFLYVGVEVMAGDTIISYGRSLGIP